jgi:hypothetical protein
MDFTRFARHVGNVALAAALLLDRGCGWRPPMPKRPALRPVSYLDAAGAEPKARSASGMG